MVVIIILIALIYFYSRHLHSSLIKNGILIQGETFSITHPGKHGPQLNFTYQVNGKHYESSAPLPRLNNDDEAYVLVNKTFPLVVDTTDIRNTKMLFDSISIINYGFKYPDTLRWINKYIP